MFLLNFKDLKLQTLKDLWANYQEVCIIVLGVIALLFILWLIAIICSKKNKKCYKKLVKANLQKEIEVQQNVSSKQPVVEEELVVEETSTNESIEEPITEEVQEEPVVEEPVVEEPVVEEPVVEEPVVEEPVVEEPVVEEEKQEEVVEEPVVEEPVVEEPVVEEPVVEEKPVKKAPAKKSTVKKSTTKTTTAKAEVKEDPKEEVKEEPTPAKKPSNRGKGKYEIEKDAAGYKYNLKASNGETLIVSESYTTLTGCKNAIKRLQENAHEATVNIEKDKNDNFQFHIVKGTRTIAHSANYSTKVSATNASKAFLKYIDTDVIKVIEESSNDLEEVIVDNNDISTDTIGKIVVSKEGSNYLYKLHANNGQVICMSPVYKTLATIEKSITTFKESVYEGKFFMLKDKNENYQFKLYSKTNRLVMTGESFQTSEACRSNIVSCHRFAKNAPVEYPEE